MFDDETLTHVPCPLCGKPPTEKGHDACIANLPGVNAACCGHGRERGYVFFASGQIIRGWFDHIFDRKWPRHSQMYPGRPVGIETAKSYARKIDEGFWDRFLLGERILEIGFRGHTDDRMPLTDTTIGVDLGFPGYDGTHLPFVDGSQDAVYSSHCLEHIADYRTVLREWFRVLRVGGHLIIVVPHAFLYERTEKIPPSRWNGDHKRAYTAGSLLMEIERALMPNTYRIRHLMDNDAGYDYARKPDEHPHGCYELELVLEKIQPPQWSVGR